MSGEWKPGDVAMVAGMLVFYTDGDRGPRFTFGDGSSGPANAIPVDPSSRLVVIDPEDMAQTQRLGEAYCAANPAVAIGPNVAADRLQTALREYANPTPPTPAEPQGLGAVVGARVMEPPIHAAMWRDYKHGTLCGVMPDPTTLLTTVTDRATCPRCRSKIDGTPVPPTTAADAWDEGYEAAYGDLLDRDPHRTKNPYAQGESQ